MDALYYLGRIADYRDEADRAIRFFSEVRHGSNAVESQRRAAFLLAHDKDDLSGALTQLDEFAKAAPPHAVDALLAKAQILASLDKDGEALKLYEKIVDFRPDSIQAALGVAPNCYSAWAGSMTRWATMPTRHDAGRRMPSC